MHVSVARHVLNITDAVYWTLLLLCTMDHYLRLHCKNAKIVNDRIDLKFVLTGSKIVKLLLITFGIE